MKAATNTAPPAAASPISGPQRRFLIGIALLGAVPRLLDAVARPIDYNGFWHVFIARNLSREWRNFAHPPLFVLLLRVADGLSRSAAAYRSISFVSGIAAVYLVGRILAKLGASKAVTALGALTMALAGSAIALSSEVESYALCAALILAAFWFYLDLADFDREPAAASRAGFAVFASLALLSHYFTGLFLVAAVAAPLAALLDDADRQAAHRALAKRWAADLGTLALPAAVAAALYLLHARRWTIALNSLPGFYFAPHSETLLSYLVRNLKNTVNLFSPVSFEHARLALPVLVLFLAALLAAPLTERRRTGLPSTRPLPAVFLALLLALGMLLGALGVYPFGGWMRQQFLLLMFALLAGLVALDRVVRSRSKTAGFAILGAYAIAVVASFAAHVPSLVRAKPDPLLAKLAPNEDRILADGAIHVDQFDLVGIFMRFHSWRWRFEGATPRNPRVEMYEASDETHRLRIFAHRNVWLFDFGDPAVFGEISGDWVRASRPCETLFEAGRTITKPVQTALPVDRRAALAARLETGASGEGLDPRETVVSAEGDVFVEWCVPGPPRIGATSPSETSAGVGFQIQPDGRSAISVSGSQFRRGAAVTLGGRPLETAFGNPSWLTATVPADLYASPGTLEIRVVNPDGASSPPAAFTVRAKS